jgi:protein-glutamine gamma-glutamyltransferase
MPRTAAAVEKFFQLSLLGLVVSGFLAVAGSGYLDTPTILLTGAGLVLRAAMAAGLLKIEISERAITVLTIAYIGFYPLDYQFLSRDFLASMVHFLFFLAIAKILTAKTNRDYLYTAIIALLELLAAAVLSAQLNFFLFLGLFLLFAIATLSSAEIRRAMQAAQGASEQTARIAGRSMSPRLGGLVGAISLGVLLMTLWLFFLLPRTANAALRHLASKGYFLPGFSNQVTLGQIGEIKTRSTPVMHVRVYNNNGRLTAKWRGAALSEFDGKRWFNSGGEDELLPVTNGRLILADESQRRRHNGRLVAYRVDLRPIDSTALFFAGTPEFLNIDAKSVYRTANGNYRIGLGPSDGVRYDVYSFLDEEASPDPEASPTVAGPAVTACLKLPPLDPRIGVLAREMSAGGISAYNRAKAVERGLQTNYAYTLELPQNQSSDPLAQFLFTRRKGHCEYFASSMAVMLRTIGIPSRLVTGFQSGAFNPLTELYVVRTSDAHSWVEAWLPGRGWTTFDPTPADPAASTSSLWSKLAIYADAADTFWQEWVLSYDLGRQLALADRMEQSTRKLRVDWLRWDGASTSHFREQSEVWLRHNGAAAGVLFVFTVVLIVAGPRSWRFLRLRQRVRRARSGQVSVADATVLYNRFLETLETKGYSKPAWFTPNEFVRSLRDAELARVAARFVDAYQELRFGGKAEASPRLSLLFEELQRLG